MDVLLTNNQSIIFVWIQAAMREARVLIVESKDINNNYLVYQVWEIRTYIIQTDGDDQASYEEVYNIDEQIRVQQLKEMVWPPLPYCDSSWSQNFMPKYANKDTVRINKHFFFVRKWRKINASQNNTNKEKKNFRSLRDTS